MMIRGEVMRDVTITLLSQKPSELNQFLNTYFDQKVEVAEGAFMWSCIYQEPLASVSLISTLMDNNEKYKIEALISIEHLDSIRVSEDNIEDLIKLMYFRYYT